MIGKPQVQLHRIMLIDDNETDLFIIKKVLQNSGSGKEIYSFTSAQEALNTIQSTPLEKLPDTIFLDINMPGMNGHVFLIEFDNLPANVKNTCRIVVLSSSNNLKEIDAIRSDKNVFGFLPKPFNMQELNQMEQLK
jgi:CheY-like chemotaxis protein